MRPLRLCIGILVTASAIGGCAGSRPAATRDTAATASPPDRASAPRDPREAERHFTDGSLLSMRSRHADAIAAYRQALAHDSARGAIYHAIGRSFRELNEVDSAIHYSRLAIQRAPTLDAHEQLADLLMLAGDIDGAITEYEALLELEPDHLQSRYLLARLLQRRDPARAMVHYEYILRNLTDDADVMLRLAELHLEMGNVEGAVDMMRRMLALEPTSADLHMMTTTLLLDAGRFGEAIEILRAAESHVPSGSALEGFYREMLREVGERIRDARPPADSIASYARELVIRASASSTSSSVRLLAGSVALAIGEDARAEALFTRALDDSAASAESWTQIAETYLDQGDAITGMRIVAPSAGRFADDFRVARMMGSMHDAAGALDSAVDWLRRSIDLYEDNAESWGMLGSLYERLDRVGESVAAYEKSIDLDPENPTVLNNYAYSLARRGSRLDHALELVRMALAMEPENETYLDTRGWIHYRRGELDEALEFLQRAVDAGGASADVYEHLGDVRKARNEYAEAHAAYTRAAALEPDRPGIDERLRSVR